MLVAGHAVAADADTLRLYAALAKLEANKAEAAGALLLAAMPGHSDEIYAEAAEDWASDSAQIASYVSAIRELDLTDGQREAVERFATGWAEAAAAGDPLVAGYRDDAAYRAQVFDWWESLDDLDDLVDDVLEDILEAEGVAFEDD
jgi:hypothetical protein